eukprot:TRINITY_DN11246_c0_g1_i1.p1 TRINITY_DN11246_c0_g1~~TRINITY_DN11246_c0_g1_i1.p1  ORF type:complete len:650 (+),score=74.55 TRINITY_DN11246_c0_g1_i1:48-1952(+)
MRASRRTVSPSCAAIGLLFLLVSCEHFETSDACEESLCGYAIFDVAPEDTSSLVQTSFNYIAAASRHQKQVRGYETQLEQVPRRSETSRRTWKNVSEVDANRMSNDRALPVDIPCGRSSLGQVGVVLSNVARLASLHAGGSSVATLVFLLVQVILCTLSVGLYVRSQCSDDSSPAAAKSAASPSAAKDDASIGLSSPSGASARPRLFRRGTVVLAELKHRHWTIDDSNETMSPFTFVVNMFADLCPPGFLPLAAGLKDTGYIPGFAIMLIFYGLCVYTMYAIAKTSEITGGKDFACQWSSTIGPRSSWVPGLVVVLVCFGCTLSYSCFFADIFASVMPAIGFPMSRSACLLTFTVFPTLPLCLLKNLSALSHSSTFALVAVIYTAVVMVLRLCDGSYAIGGKYYNDLPVGLTPKVPSNHLLGFGIPSLALVNGLALAFLSHYNGCKYYRELKKHTPSRLAKCTATAMGIAVVLFGATMIAGFQTFGTNASSVILQNYSEHDAALNVARLAVGLSIVASFPLMFSGLREATIALLKHYDNTSDWDSIWKQDTLSMLLLALITTVASLVTDAGIVVGVVGAVCGSAIIYVVPCTLYASAIRGYMTDSHDGTVILLRCLIGLGAFLALSGLIATFAF